MECQKVKRKAWIRFLIVLLFCSVIPVFLLGTTYARITENVSKELSFSYQAGTEQIYIRAVDHDPAAVTKEDENLQTIGFVLSNGEGKEQYCEYDQVATLMVFATLGIENPEELTITLHDKESAYTAQCQAVSKDSVLYSMYGPGWVYQFYNAAGEEINWYFSGTNYIERQMYITIEGTSDLPVNLNLIVNGKPGIV